MKITLKAYAKINLHLDVTAKRSDGYHDVENVMQTIGIFDTVTVEKTEKNKIEIECDSPNVPLGEENIAYRAVEAFFASVEECFGVKITIKKGIPMAAGLAGGSTDAAAVLVALNSLCGEPLDYKALCDVASTLGADVPFCIKGGCAYSDGRGDVLHPFPGISENTAIVVACGGEGVSTPWAYKLLDAENNNFVGYIPHGTDMLRAAAEQGNGFEKHIFNLFEKSVLPKRPIAQMIKQTMLEGGAVASMMSGSGPSIIGFFLNFDAAEKCAEAINAKGYFAKATAPVFEQTKE